MGSSQVHRAQEFHRIEHRKDTDSYVWYFRGQGYDTIYHHPGYGWFYNRQNVNDYLGFQRQWFTANHYGALVDPQSAIYHSDDVLVDGILSDLRDRFTEGDWAFSFSVSSRSRILLKYSFRVTSWIRENAELAIQ